MKVVSIYQSENRKKVERPLFLSSVSAGFPSPADDGVDHKLDLNEALIAHPAATFFIRVEGDSMREAGILSRDLLIVDRSLNAKEGTIVVAVLNGEFTVKKIHWHQKTLYLYPANKNYRPIKVTQEMDFTIWGVVIHAIHSF